MRSRLVWIGALVGLAALPTGRGLGRRRREGAGTAS